MSLRIVDPLRCVYSFWSCRSQADNTTQRDNDMDESLDNRLDMSTGCPEATMAQPSTSNIDLHTVPPMLTDFRADDSDETQTLTTTGAREEGVPAPTAPEESFLSTPAPPTNETQGPTTTGACKEGASVPALTTVEEFLSTPAPPTNATLPEDPPQLDNGPAPKKRKVAARAITSNCISDK